MNRLQTSDVNSMEACVDMKDIRRFFVRAGLQLTTDECLGMARTALVAYVNEIIPHTIANMEMNYRMKCLAEDVSTAMQFCNGPKRVYGFEDVDAEPDEGLESENDVEDEENEENEKSEQDSDDSDDDEEWNKKVDNEIEKDEEAGDGYYSDAENQGMDRHLETYTEEDSHWIEDNRFNRIEDSDVERILSKDQPNPYLIPRSAFARMWDIAMNVSISKAALSMLHNAAEYYLYSELSNGKLGSDIACVVLQSLIMEQAEERDRLENQIETQAVKIKEQKAAITKLKNQRGTPRKSLAVTDPNASAQKKIQRKRLSCEMLQENQPPTPQRYAQSPMRR
ncbi:hypothetical protein THRCLA_05981 [Thraustotheca clavata]|uniref:Uncharacterized protein n=1 Tax=Thraustotheca clavata TaxID=74557 RepID=A0A1V9ZQW2_9STRA|nr:hypothetical protein THRCLA_05981 [Thraustotheca clavata]